MIRLAAFQGKSLISRIIRAVTYSEYSHLGMEFAADMEVGGSRYVRCINRGSVIEAWKGGVKLSSSISERHTPGTAVDLFEFKTPLSRHEAERMAIFLLSQIGKPYDYLNVARFLPIVRMILPRPGPASTIYRRKHLFCSELCVEACRAVGRDIIMRCPAWQVPPRDAPRSPLLRLSENTTTA
jgi:uncharacterized protein YycO